MRTVAAKAAVVAATAWLVPGPAGCSKRSARDGSAAALLGSGMAAGSDGGGGGDLPTDPREIEAWKRAEQGGDEDRIRLEDLLGCERLREAAEHPQLRATAIQAMAYCGDFSMLPWLVEIAASAQGDEAIEALDAIVEQAARPRRATDPEDANELGEGCHSLLDLARAHRQPPARRARAVRALRMLAERGCVNRDEIPRDLDAK
jgi:hypothetical protein